MASKLTKRDRDTLNAAWRIIDRCTAQGSSWLIGAYRYGDLDFAFDITYFDSNKDSARGQHCFVRGETFADKIQTVLEIEERAAANAEKHPWA